MTRPYKAELTAAAEHLDANRLEEAEVLLDALYVKAPLDPYVLYNCALLRSKTGRRDEAIVFYRRAVGADPNLVPALINLCQSLFFRGDLREALRYAQMALRRQPGDPSLLHAIALVLIGLGEAKDALEATEDGLRVAPQHLGLLTQRMVALSELAQTNEALQAAFRVVEHPNGRNHFDALSMITSISSKRSDWDTLEQYTPRFIEVARRPETNLNPLQLTFHSDDPELIGETAHRRAKTMTMPARPARLRSDGRIVIAYMSPDLREHPVAHMLLDVLPLHDRTAFQIHTVGTLPDGISPLSTEIARHTDGHIDLTKLDDSAAAHELRRLGVDVLVDLAGSTKWCRPGLLAKRPCPVQVLWLGCPCTTGTPYYDAFLVDETVAPPGYEQFCTEPLVRLPCCYHPISLGMGSPNASYTRSAYRLPMDKIIIGLLQQPNKIRPPLVDRIARAIAPFPHVHLWIRAHQDFHESVVRRLSQHGLPPERIQFCPHFPHRDEYLAIYRMVDIAIDSFPYGGHSTTGEALIQGTPVLTMSGRSIHTRVAASMMREMGLDDLVLPNLDALEATLHNLLAEPSRLPELKNRFALAAARQREHGSRPLVAALECAFRKLVADVPAPD